MVQQQKSVTSSQIEHQVVLIWAARFVKYSLSLPKVHKHPIVLNTQLSYSVRTESLLCAV